MPPHHSTSWCRARCSASSRKPAATGCTIWCGRSPAKGWTPQLRLEVEARHAEHYCAVLARADDLYLSGGNDVLGGLALFDEERTNIAVGQSMGVRASRCASRRGPFDLCLRECRCRRPGPPSADPRAGSRWLDDAVAACRALGDRRGEGNALGNLGIAWADLGETRKAIEFYEQLLAIAREIGDRRGEGNALGNLGIAWADLGEPRKAIEYHEQQPRDRARDRRPARRGQRARQSGPRLDGSRRAAQGDRATTSSTSRSRARSATGAARATRWAIWASPGRISASRARRSSFYEQRLAIAREIGDRRGEGSALGNLGNAWADLGETRKAIELYEQSLAIAREIGDRRGADTALVEPRAGARRARRRAGGDPMRARVRWSCIGRPKTRSRRRWRLGSARRGVDPDAVEAGERP